MRRRVLLSGAPKGLKAKRALQKKLRERREKSIDVRNAVHDAGVSMRSYLFNKEVGRYGDEKESFHQTLATGARALGSAVKEEIAGYKAERARHRRAVKIMKMSKEERRKYWKNRQEVPFRGKKFISQEE